MMLEDVPLWLHDLAPYIPGLMTLAVISAFVVGVVTFCWLSARWFPVDDQP